MIASITIGARQPIAKVTVIPLTAVVRSPSNPNGFAVFVTEGTGDTVKVHTQDVTLGDTYGNMIAVLQWGEPERPRRNLGSKHDQEWRSGEDYPLSPGRSVMTTHHKSDAEIIATTHNVARFFTEHRQVRSFC